jgi:hypothetical protein
MTVFTTVHHLTLEKRFSNIFWFEKAGRLHSNRSLSVKRTNSSMDVGYGETVFTWIN